jgi:PEP-CTERM motif
MKLLSVSFAVVSLMLAGSAQAITYTGATSLTGPTFNRPLATLTGLSAVGTAVHYDAYTFTVPTTGSYNFLSLATGAWDNFLILYSPTFVPTAGLTNAVAANDDGPPPAGIGSAGFTFNLTAGTSYTLVTTGFGNNDVGAFTNTINAVPEPTTYALMALGLAAIGFASLKRKQT